MSATPKKECRLVAVILLCAGLDGAPCWPDNAAESEGNLPPPAQVFTPRTALAVYVNLQDANKSAIWRAIADKAGPLAEHFQTLQQGKLSSMQAVHGIPGFNPTNVAEIAIALEGDKILSDLQTEHFDPASGFVAVVRLAPAQDVDTLIQQTLEAIDKEKPGLRGPIEKSRRRARSAEVFDIPAELLGELKLPFSVSCAIGPGQEGTLLCLGRSENLQAFLSGKTIGKLRGAINETLSRRGQIWFHATMPKDASKNLGGSGPDANPMLAGLAQSLDKVRDASLSLNFAAGQIDFEIDLGCADGAAASGITQGIQELLAMIQLSARQNLSSAPPFIGKTKVAADGASFRLTTAFTMRDIDLAFQNVNRGVAGARPRPSAESPNAEETAAPSTPTLSPVNVEFVQFKSDEEESLRQARMRIYNRSAQAVKELRLTFTYGDESGRKLGQWTRNHSSLTAENLIAGETTQVVDCLAFHVPAFTKKVTVTVHEVTFANGEKWSPTP